MLLIIYNSSGGCIFFNDIHHIQMINSPQIWVRGPFLRFEQILLKRNLFYLKNSYLGVFIVLFVFLLYSLVVDLVLQSLRSNYIYKRSCGTYPQPL